MTVKYREFEIDVYREKCMGGWPLLYYSILRICDGWELTSGFDDSRETIREKSGSLKRGWTGTTRSLMIITRTASNTIRSGDETR